MSPFDRRRLIKERILRTRVLGKAAAERAGLKQAVSARGKRVNHSRRTDQTVHATLHVANVPPVG